MTFKPTTRSPRANMDRWAILADSHKQGRAWLRRNFIIYPPGMKKDVRWNTIAPIFDPNDPFEVMIVIDSRDLHGMNFYQMIDVRTELKRTHDAVLEESSRLRRLETSLRQHPEGPKSQHPHPAPTTWENLDRYDFRRRWISPDPFPISKVKTRLFPTPPARKDSRDS